MKMKELYTLACILYITGCSKPSTDEIEIVKNLFPVQFSIQLEKEVLPFPSLRSIPDSPIPEPVIPDAENPDKELGDLCTQIEYAVFQQGETAVPFKQKKYTTTDADFGIVYDTLPKGCYQICFLAHNSETTFRSGTILAFDSVPDVFYNSQMIEINPDEAVNNDISLQRIVSRIEFYAMDTVPRNIGCFDMLIEDYPNKLDILTGKGIVNKDKILISYPFASNEIGKKGMVHSFYTFIPPGNEKITAKLCTTDKNKLPLREHSISGIMPQRNKVIRYSGRLYSKVDSDDTFQLTVSNNGEWAGTEEHDLPD